MAGAVRESTVGSPAVSRERDDKILTVRERENTI